MNSINQQKRIAATVTDLQSGSVEVLYQKMGDRWFAFSMINDEVFVGSISQEEIDQQGLNLDRSNQNESPALNPNA